jgi:outer membrane protein insertion porin family
VTSPDACQGSLGRRGAAWLLVLWLALLSRGVAAQEGEIVRQVVLSGQVGVDHDLLRANLRTRAGLPLHAADLDEDVRWLADVHGILAEVGIETGPVVRFLLSRIRRYDHVGVEGNVRYDEEELLGVARLTKERDATPDQLTTGRDLVRQHYLQAGYAFVQVDVRSRTDADGRWRALLRVYEGPHVETQDVQIEGLTALKPSDALGVMSSPPGFWSWLVGKDFVRSEVDADVVLLENFVRGEGYLDGRVALDRFIWSEDRSEVTVVMLVDEGPRYSVRSVAYAGVSAVTEAELSEVTKIHPGSPWRRPDVLRCIRAFRDLYGRRGYIDAKIEPRETFDASAPMLDVVWRVDEGVQKSVRDVLIRGNAGTRDDVIRRYVTAEPGQIVDTSELRWSEDVLVSLDYFTDFEGTPQVRVDTAATPAPDTVDVTVDVNDEQSGLFSFIVGAGSDSGVFGGVSVNKRNFDLTKTPTGIGRTLTEFFGTGEAFHGGGQRLFFEVIPGTETTEIDVTFRDPWLDSTDREPWGLTTNLYDREREFSEYTRSNTGLGVAFDHQLSRRTTVSMGVNIEDVDISDVNAVAVPTIALSEGTTRSQALELGYSYRNLDSLYEPSTGFGGAVRVESAGNGLGGETDLLRLTLTGEWFVPIAEDDDGHKSVLHPRVAIGRVEPTSGQDTLPFFDNFFVGGATGPFAVRGFDYQGVGPHESDDAIGGQLAMVVSVEALVPLITKYNPFRDEDETLLKGVLFVDAGNLLPDTKFGDLDNDVRLGAGGGMRLRIPALGGITLALDYALVTRDQPGDERRALSFELSRRF